MPKKEKNSTQSYLSVSEVKDGVIVLKNGSLRSVIAVSSLNFALKSEDEQNAIIGAYQNFLNSLDHPVQIIMQSRPMDITPYLDNLRKRVSTMSNKLMQMQTQEYIEFVSKLVDTAEIMSKNFFVVVPYSGGGVTKEGVLNKFSQIFNPTKSTVVNKSAFTEYKKELKGRVENVRGELASMGLDTIELTTEEVLELLYSSYNIGAAPALSVEALQSLEISSNTKENLNE